MEMRYDITTYSNGSYSLVGDLLDSHRGVRIQNITGFLVHLRLTEIQNELQRGLGFREGK